MSDRESINDYSEWIESDAYWEDEEEWESDDQVFNRFTLNARVVKAEFREQMIVSFRVPDEFKDSLKELDLDFNELELDQCNFTACPNLETISLRGNGIVDFSCILRMKSLKTLILSQNNVGDEQIEAISSLNNLETLHLSYNRINSSVMHLIDIGQNLKSLSLMANPFMANPEAFIRGIAKLKKLENLIIGQNIPIGDSWDSQVAWYIKSNPCILSLVVYGIYDLNKILEATEHNTILRQLHIVGKDLSGGEMRKVLNPFCTIIKFNSENVVHSSEISPVYENQVKHAIIVSRLLRLIPELWIVKENIISVILEGFAIQDASAMVKSLMRPNLDTSQVFDHHLFKRTCILESRSSNS